MIDPPLHDRPTARELDALRAYLAAGSVKDAAHRMGMSESALKRLLMNARSRLGARSTAELVYLVHDLIAA